LSYAVVAAIYAPGLSGGFVFDDFPNIVDNTAVQPKEVSLASFVAAALSSPSSELKRPLASLTFAANVLFTGLDPGAMKVTNLLIHLLNGLLVFVLFRMLMRVMDKPWIEYRITAIAAAGSFAWLVLPINLTAVLYVVQRMESLANLFVLLGLIGYVRVRSRLARRSGKIVLPAIACIVAATAAGLMAKETAILLPLYALCVETCVFHFRWSDGSFAHSLAWAYGVMLVPPILIGAAWLGPGILDDRTWATRDFTLTTRLLSEPRILVDYLRWTVLPTLNDLSFYHDDFVQSTGWLTPWTTTASIIGLTTLAVFAWILRRSLPLFSLGIALFFACHTLTATVLPLELVYEHRNYFASIGVVLAVTDLIALAVHHTPYKWRRSVLIVPICLIIVALHATLVTAYAWGSPLGLAEELGRRAPASPRAQYELGRAYIIESHYDPASPSTQKAYAPLERAADLPGSSILPQQALIFFNARLHRPVKPTWWTSLQGKLTERPATVQDESSLGSLSSCLNQGLCDFPATELDKSFRAAMSHSRVSARLIAMYANFAWESLDNHQLALQLQRKAVDAAPNEGAYRIGLVRMLIQSGMRDQALNEIEALRPLNVAGRYERDIRELRTTFDRSGEPAEPTSRP